MTGIQLRIKRMRAGVKACELAEQMGCANSWVTQLEYRRSVPHVWAGKYLAGLNALIEQHTQEIETHASDCNTTSGSCDS